MADELKLLGKWKSPGGETKLFTSPLVSLKWQSKTSKRITIYGTPNEVNYVIKQLKSICEEAAMNSTTNQSTLTKMLTLRLIPIQLKQVQ